MQELLANVKKLATTIGTLTSEQQELLQHLESQIKKNGLFYEVTSTSLTINLMREHGYNVTEDDADVIDTIASKTEVDEDMLWAGVAAWAGYYGLKMLEDF